MKSQLARDAFIAGFATLSEGHSVADFELAISTIESYPDKGNPSGR